jgi:ribosomal protein L44E
LSQEVHQEQVEQKAAEATEGRKLLESELQGAEDEGRRLKREEQARKEKVVEEAVHDMRFTCDVCGNKSYKSATEYTNHLDSCARPSRTAIM